MEANTGQGRSSVKKADIDELRKLHNPPQLVKDELSATLLLLGYSESQSKDWRFLRSLFSKTGEDSFLNKLARTDFNKIPADGAQKAKDILKTVQSADEVKCKSAACYAIHLWNEDAINTALANSGNTES